MLQSHFVAKARMMRTVLAGSQAGMHDMSLSDVIMRARRIDASSSRPYRLVNQRMTSYFLWILSSVETYLRVASEWAQIGSQENEARGRYSVEDRDLLIMSDRDFLLPSSNS